MSIGIQYSNTGFPKYDSVVQLKTIDLSIGETAETVAYYSGWSAANILPKGGCVYDIVTAVNFTAITGDSVADGYGDHVLDNGNVAMARRDENLSVLQYGAKGDGTTDDKLAINALIASGIQEVRFFEPNTSYAIGGALTELARYQSITGGGGGDGYTHLNILNSASDFSVINISDNNVVSGFRFEGTGITNGTCVDGSSEASNNYISDCWFREMKYGFQMVNGYNNWISGCEFRQLTEGVHIVSSTGGSGQSNTLYIDKTRFYQCQNYSVYINDSATGEARLAAFSNVNFDGGYASPTATAHCYLNNVSTADFTSCYFEDTTAGTSYCVRGLNGSTVNLTGCYIHGTKGILMDDGSLGMTNCRSTQSGGATNDPIVMTSVNGTVYLNGCNLKSTSNSVESCRFTITNSIYELSTAQSRYYSTAYKFPATAVANTDVNTLDDYEEGTFTPVWDTGFSAATYDLQAGYYTKIGNTLNCWVSLTVSATTPSGNLGLVIPFTTLNRSPALRCIGNCMVETNSGTLTENSVIFSVNNNTDTGQILQQGTGGTSLVPGSELGNGTAHLFITCGVV